MSLQLDARQRAMLQEMGITLWQAAPTAAVASPTQRPGSVGTSVLERPPAHPQPATPDARTPATSQQPQPAAPNRATTHTPTHTSAPTPVTAPAAQLRAPTLLYPDADAASAPPELGNGWLVIFETPTPDEPLGGDAGRLLDNMLRAMQLHRHPRVHACVLERGTGTGADTPQSVQAALAQTLSELRPSMALILGLGAARATLDNREPLGRLRAAQHQLPGGTPAFVSYDPAYLLRAPDAKASAWADLCRALAVVRKATET